MVFLSVFSEYSVLEIIFNLYSFALSFWGQNQSIRDICFVLIYVAISRNATENIGALAQQHSLIFL